MSGKHLRSTVPPQTPSFGERYELIEKLGSGGMGAVYKAQDKSLKKLVAIKILLPGLSNETIIRFQHEARAAAKFDHQNIVTVLDFGQTKAGDLYLVMDYVDGSSLEDLIKQNRYLPIERALPIFVQICDGLKHAHNHGVMHRDVKPSNIMVDDTDHVWIVDFGLAKLKSNDDLKLTTTGVRVGSPLYMSPEQAAGNEVDFRSDIYSLGCLIYKTLTGTVPLAGDTYMETILMHQETEPPPLNDNEYGLVFPQQVQALVDKTLAKSQDERFQTAEQVKESLLDLEQWLSSPENTTQQQSTGMWKKKSTTSWKTYAFVALGLALLSFSAVLVSTSLLSKDPIADEMKNTEKVTQKEQVGILGIKYGDFRRHGHGHGYGHGHGRDAKSAMEYRIRSIDEALKNPAFVSRCREYPDLSKALDDGSLRKIWLDDRASVWDEEDYEEIPKAGLWELWIDHKFKAVWDDPEVCKFVVDPANWKNWNQKTLTDPVMVKYRKNPHIKQLMADDRFDCLIKETKFNLLVLEPRFRRMVADPTYLNFCRVFGQYKAGEHMQRLQDEMKRNGLNLKIDKIGRQYGF